LVSEAGAVALGLRGRGGGRGLRPWTVIGRPGLIIQEEDDQQGGPEDHSNVASHVCVRERGRRRRDATGGSARYASARASHPAGSRSARWPAARNSSRKGRNGSSRPTAGSLRAGRAG